MTKSNTNQSAHYLQAIIDYEINIEFCDKIVWLRPRREGLSFLTEDVGIKLKDVGGDKMEAVKKGIDIILNEYLITSQRNYGVFMDDKIFLQRLKENKVKWTREELETAKRLSKIGLTKYETDMHAGWWEVTAEGGKYLNT